MERRSDMKYNNRKTVIDGIAFDSKREATRWQQSVVVPGRETKQ